MNNYWLIPDWLMGGGWPDDFTCLQQNKISIIVNLTEQAYANHEFEIFHIPIIDMTPPGLPQIARFCAIVESSGKRNSRVYVHCLAGLGRTGTMMACFLVKQERCTAKDAMARVRLLQPGSIETDEQEQVVYGWHRFLFGKDAA